MNKRTIQDEIQSNGFSVCQDVLSPSRIDELIEAFGRIHQDESAHRRGGIRNLLALSPKARELSGSSEVTALVEVVLGPGAFPVRGILFDKIPEANWKVPWHQDVTIAVQKRVEAEGFGPWTMKADVVHVQSPAAIAAILEKMLSVRLHLDECGEKNGALRVIPGSHRSGRIPEGEIPSIRKNSSEHVCAVRRGDALLIAACFFAITRTWASPGDSSGFCNGPTALRSQVG